MQPTTSAPDNLGMVKKTLDLQAILNEVDQKQADLLARQADLDTIRGLVEAVTKINQDATTFAKAVAQNEETIKNLQSELDAAKSIIAEFDKNRNVVPAP